MRDIILTVCFSLVIGIPIFCIFTFVENPRKEIEKKMLQKYPSGTIVEHTLSHEKGLVTAVNSQWRVWVKFYNPNRGIQEVVCEEFEIMRITEPVKAEEPCQTQQK